jgi:hypothetical protein
MTDMSGSVSAKNANAPTTVARWSALGFSGKPPGDFGVRRLGAGDAGGVTS